MKHKKTTKSAAVLTIYNAPGMTKRRRDSISEWLRATSRLLAGSSSMEEVRRFGETRTRLTLRRNWDYSAKGRKAISAWLRMHAKYLEQHGKNYAKRFTGRYLYA